MQSIHYENIQNDDMTSIKVTIPPNTPNYTQYFDNCLHLDPKKLHFIRIIDIQYRLTGFTNIFKRTYITLTSNINTPNFRTNIIFEPGLYSAINILTKINSSSPNKPYMLFENSKFTIINYGNNGSSITFDTLDLTLIKMMGFYNTQTSHIFKFASATSVVKPGYFTISANKDYTATNEFDSVVVWNAATDSNSNRSILIGCDLILEASLLGQNYIAMCANSYVVKNVNLTGPQSTLPIHYHHTCLLPLAKNSISCIDWKLNTISGDPFYINNSITVNLIILSRDK